MREWVIWTLQHMVQQQFCCQIAVLKLFKRLGLL